VTVGADQLAYIGAGRHELLIDCYPGTRFLLLGGTPFEEDILMWWNFVARSRDEIETACRDWSGQHERFGSVHSTLSRIEAPRPFWT
jgi:redox-sensitive bicupin YhaK (pirin superfamily)